uniref:Uncharacterized protein n=1 Tax=Glossina brevipalpis TaxID=37001 RepID=A0A1A9WN90_9MUSC
MPSRESLRSVLPIPIKESSMGRGGLLGSAPSSTMGVNSRRRTSGLSKSTGGAAKFSTTSVRIHQLFSILIIFHLDRLEGYGRIRSRAISQMHNTAKERMAFIKEKKLSDDVSLNFTTFHSLKSLIIRKSQQQIYEITQATQALTKSLISMIEMHDFHVYNETTAIIIIIIFQAKSESDSPTFVEHVAKADAERLRNCEIAKLRIAVAYCR